MLKYHRLHTTMSWTLIMELQTKEKIAPKMEYMSKERGQTRTRKAWKAAAAGGHCSHMKCQGRMATNHSRFFCFLGLGKYLCYHGHTSFLFLFFNLRIVLPIKFSFLELLSLEMNFTFFQQNNNFSSDTF